MSYRIAEGFLAKAELVDLKDFHFGQGIVLDGKPFEPPKEFKFKWDGDDLPEFQFVWKDIELEVTFSGEQILKLCQPEEPPRCLRPTPWRK